jgi:exopolysaccharide biosynthesis protein
MESQKGVSLIITFFVMIIILSVVLSISVLLYGQIKVIRNMGNSVASYYAGESGIEKVLFYDKQVLPSSGGSDKRGLCYMFEESNPNRCHNDTSKNEAVRCQNYPSDFTGTCAPDNCTACTISFDTVLGGATYHTRATVTASAGIFSIDSTGNFSETSRKVEAVITNQPN